MVDLLTPALLDQLLGAAVGATGAAFVIAITTPVRRRRRQNQRRNLDPAPWGPWHESLPGAHQARQAARMAMEDWRLVHGPMSARQAITFAAVILGSDNVRGWTDEFDVMRLNVISSALRLNTAHQPTSGGRNGAGGAQ
jgi:hypothetical protein